MSEYIEELLSADEEDIPEAQVRQAIQESLRRGVDAAIYPNPYLPPEPPLFTPVHQRRPLDGLPTGFTDLDALAGGLRPGELTIVAGGASCGASTLLQNLARKAIRRDGRGTVVLVSLDTPARQVANRILCAQARINTRVREAQHLGVEVHERLEQACSKLDARRLRIIDCWDLSLKQMITDCAALKQRDDLELVLVDTVQRIAAPDGRQAKLPEVMQALKRLAEGLEVPVVAVYRIVAESPKRPEPRETGFEQIGNLLSLSLFGNTTQATSLPNLPVPMPVKLLSDTLAILHRPDRGGVIAELNERQKGLEIVTLSVAHQVGGGSGAVHLTFLTHWGRMGGVLWEV